MFSVLRNNKKGALELSMNAIVIIVLAFAMLGLGLVFTRTLLTQATQSAGAVTDTAKQQILDSLREGNKKLSVQQEIKLQTKDSTVVGIGLKNTLGSSQAFAISIVQNNVALSPETDGITYLVKDGSGTTTGKFIFTPSKTLGADEADVIPVRFESQSAKGTSLFTIKVVDGTGADYATSDLFITVQ